MGDQSVLPLLQEVVHIKNIRCEDAGEQMMNASFHLPTRSSPPAAAANFDILISFRLSP